MITAQEMEMMTKATTNSFNKLSYDPMSTHTWMNAQRRKMERKERWAEAFENAKKMVKEWFQGFHAQLMFGAY